jgi:hypothetical protein
MPSVYLLQILTDVPAVTRARVAEVQRWLASSPALEFLQVWERHLLTFFSGFSGFAQSGARAQPIFAPAFAFLALNSQSSAEHIALVRVLAHVAAGVLAAGNSKTLLFSWYRTLVSNPDSLRGTFFPCAPEDIQFMVGKALGGRWYKCSNGHVRNLNFEHIYFQSLFERLWVMET